MNPTICTYSGLEFAPLNPDPTSIRIEDIAHALAAMPRFAGHTTVPYSVAEHSIWVSEHVPPHLARHGLLHDAARAYILDLLGPTKRMLPDYLDVERHLAGTIFRRFGLDPRLLRAPSLKAVDDLALLAEWRDLKQANLAWWGVPVSAIRKIDRIKPMGAEEAEKAFLERFRTVFTEEVRTSLWPTAQSALGNLQGWAPNPRAEVLTYSGMRIDPNQPASEHIRIEDIAVALSRIPRFAGHTRKPYSVAQHSVWVSRQCHPAESMKGLLHDATEAYLLDMPSPIKKFFPAYAAQEKRLMACIYEAFDLDPADLKPPSVKRADELSLWLEQRDLMPGPLSWWQTPSDRVLEFPELEPLSPAEAEMEFVERFEEIVSFRKTFEADPDSFRSSSMVH